AQGSVREPVPGTACRGRASPSSGLFRGRHRGDRRRPCRDRPVPDPPRSRTTAAGARGGRSMTLGLREERLDAAIVAFLDELSRDTADAPSTDEMAIRVSGGRASARRSSARWQALLVAAVVVAAAVSALVVGSERVEGPLPPPPDL